MVGSTGIENQSAFKTGASPGSQQWRDCVLRHEKYINLRLILAPPNSSQLGQRANSDEDLTFERCLIPAVYCASSARGRAWPEWQLVWWPWGVQAPCQDERQLRAFNSDILHLLPRKRSSQAQVSWGRYIHLRIDRQNRSHVCEWLKSSQPEATVF